MADQVFKAEVEIGFDRSVLYLKSTVIWSKAMKSRITSIVTLHFTINMTNPQNIQLSITARDISTNFVT